MLKSISRNKSDFLIELENLILSTNNDIKNRNSIWDIPDYEDLHLRRDDQIILVLRGNSPIIKITELNSGLFFEVKSSESEHSMCDRLSIRDGEVVYSSQPIRTIDDLRIVYRHALAMDLVQILAI